MKTIKQISEDLGVSKQAVYKRYKGKLYPQVRPYTHTKHGTVYIDDQGENIIKQDFLKDRTSSDVSNGADTEYIPVSLIDTLNRSMEALQNQLLEKDKQIAELTKLLNQSQQLHGGTLQQLKNLDDVDTTHRIDVTSKIQKHKFFDIFFKR